MPDALIWPTVAVICIIILGIIALILLRPALLRLIDRTSKAGKDGITFERPQEGKNPQQSLLSFDDLMKLPITATVLSREKTTEVGLQSFKLRDEKEKTAVLIRALATTQVALEFNNISAIIFGSQLNLLVHLSGTTQGVSLEQAEIIFKQAQKNFPALHETRTLIEWLSYLLTHNLVTQTNDKIDITQYGTDFLKHLVDSRLAYERYG